MDNAETIAKASARAAQHKIDKRKRNGPEKANRERGVKAITVGHNEIERHRQSRVTGLVEPMIGPKRPAAFQASAALVICKVPLLVCPDGKAKWDLRVYGMGFVRRRKLGKTLELSRNGWTLDLHTGVISAVTKGA